MNLAYIRVSSVDQNEIRQKEALKRYDIERWYIDFASGKSLNRPKLNEMFDFMREGDKHIVIYTGDTSTLKPFQNYINKNVLLYTEISYYKSDVHLFYEDILPDLISISSNGTKVFLMHLDNEKEIAKIIQNTSIQLAPLYTE